MQQHIARSVYTCFVDLEKAYDWVPHEKLWRRLRECDVDDRLVLAVKSLYPAEKFVFVSEELSHNWSPLVLDSDNGVCCHRSSLLWYCLPPLNKFRWEITNSRYGFFPYLLSCVIDLCGVINMTWKNNKQVVCDAFSCT